MERGEDIEQQFARRSTRTPPPIEEDIIPSRLQTRHAEELIFSPRITSFRLFIWSLAQNIGRDGQNISLEIPVTRAPKQYG